MSSCEHYYVALYEGRTADAEAHAAECAPCAELGAEGRELAEALIDARHAVAVPGDAGEAEAVLGRIDAERGIHATLRELPAAMHGFLAAVVVTSVLFAVVINGPRPDLMVYPFGRMVLVMGSMAFVLAAAAALLVRPMHRAQLPSWAGGAAVVSLIALPVALSVLPQAITGHPHAQTAQPVLQVAFGCFVYGTGAGAGLWMLLRTMERRDRPTLVGGAVGVGMLGLAGNLALQLDCPLTSPAHLLLGHASVGVVWLMVYGVLAGSKQVLQRA